MAASCGLSVNLFLNKAFVLFQVQYFVLNYVRAVVKLIYKEEIQQQI